MIKRAWQDLRNVGNTYCERTLIDTKYMCLILMFC